MKITAGLLGLTWAILGVTFWSLTSFGYADEIIPKRWYWAAILAVLIPMAVAAAYTASIGFNVQKQAPREEKLKYFRRIGQVYRVNPVHIGLLAAAVGVVVVTAILIVVQLMSPPCLLYAIVTLFGYFTFFSLVVFPRSCGLLIEQWEHEDFPE